MKLRLLNFVTALSLLLFIAALVLWARSYWRGDEVYRLARERGVYLDLACGAVTLYRDRTHVDRPRAEWAYTGHVDPGAQRRSVDEIGSRVAARTGNGFDVVGIAAWTARPLGDAPTYVRLPLWLPAALLVILPAARLRRRLRRRPGHCSACGYDIRATPDRCPECGLAAPAGEGAAA